MTTNFEPRIVGFLCNWCSYAGADMTGTSRISYPSNIRIIRVPCSGRVDPLYVLKAFQEGADGVLVAGCHPGDCHYGDGNYHARRRYALMHSFLDFVGIEAGRLRIDWVSAAEGNRFAQVVAELTDQVRSLGPWTGLRSTDDATEAGSAGVRNMARERASVPEQVGSPEHAPVSAPGGSS
jgi:F420-non-reducing hydrogenase iron-sulfur subunit